MLLKPLDLSEKKFSNLALLKIFFLIIVIAIGAFAFTQQSKVKIHSAKKSSNIVLDQKDISQKIQKTSQNLAKDTQKQTEFILGEATKVVEETASRSADTASDFIYENSLEIVINRMIELLPPRQKERFKQNFCK